jgi:F-type H+-transporting ATPase subunit delta
MQAASRESYAAAVARLESIVPDTSPEDLASTAEEVLAVAGMLRREPRLRRALSDPARTGTDRAELLRSLLGSKVSDRAADLLATLAGGRWSASAELLDAVETLGVEAILAGADRAGDLAEVEDELFRFGQTVDGNLDLAAALGESAAGVQRREELVHALLDGKAKPATIRLATVALAGYGGRNFSTSLTRLVEAAAERRERQVAYVTAAAPLTEEQERRLGAKLSELYGRDIALKVSVRPEILGGLSVQVGHDLYDGSVARRLAVARNELT